LKEAEKTIGLVEGQFVNVPDSTKKEIMKLGTALKDSISNLKDKFFQHKEEKGIKRSSKNLNSKLYSAMGYLNANNAAPNATAQTAVAVAKREAEAVVNQVNGLFEGQWKSYREKVEAVQYSLFKAVERL
jgi:hypothetical protein